MVENIRAIHNLILRHFQPEHDAPLAYPRKIGYDHHAYVFYGENAPRLDFKVERNEVEVKVRISENNPEGLRFAELLGQMAERKQLEGTLGNDGSFITFIYKIRTHPFGTKLGVIKTGVVPGDVTQKNILEKIRRELNVRVEHPE